MNKLSTYLLLSLFGLTLNAQKSFNDFMQFYPIADDPNIRFMSSYTEQETILFEANPTMRYSIYNDFIKKLMNDSAQHSQAWYVSFKPHFRMYTDNSLPVRTPSYRIFLATQHLFRLPSSKEMVSNFWGFSAESGHYSNGQDGSAFSADFADGSPQGDSLYTLITPDTDLSSILNRRSANFSTNLTELIVNYRSYGLDDDYLPQQMHSVNVGYTLYHDLFLGLGNFGGFSDNDIVLYGRHRFSATYEFMNVLKEHKDKRLSVKQYVEYIHKPHASVNPLRLETTLTFYPFQKSKALGVLCSYIYGHDNYNFRFVDAGHQLTFGLTWNQFPPLQLKQY